MKIVFYDFDGTLISSPMSKDKIIWENHYGKEYPHKGWWSKKESLDLEVFDIKINEYIIDIFSENIDDINILLTNRLDILSEEIKYVLFKKSNFIFNDYSFKLKKSSKNLTKIDRVIDLVNKYSNHSVDPSVEIEFYDDDVTHFIDYQKLIDNNVKFKCYFVNNLKPELYVQG